MINIDESIDKLKTVVTLWADENPDEYRAAKEMIGISGRKKQCGAVDSDRKKVCYHDEYYTSKEQIEYLVGLYDPAVFHGKYVYCNCDAPWSEIYKYFRDNFSRLKLRHLTATAISDDNREWRGTRSDYDGKTERIMTMDWSGSFDSAESRKILSECDMCITNPPFSLITPYIKLILESGKQFMTFMSNLNLTYYSVMIPYSEKKLYVIQSRDGGLGGFKGQINYVVVSNIPGSDELERRIFKGVRYIEYDPEIHRPADNVPGAIAINSVSAGIPLYYGGWIYCPTTLLSDLRWDRENFDVVIPPVKWRDITVDGKRPFRRLPIKLKNKDLKPTL